MDTIQGMRTFVAVASQGSFSRAAERLAVSPQLVSKYIGQLESRLGVRLIQRSTRRLSITEVGQAYFERCQQVLADIDEMENAVGALTSHAKGTLRVNAPMSFGITHLSQAIADYQRDQSDVRVNLTLNDRVVDIVDEGFDLAIRVGRLAESSLVARKLAPVRLVVCGAPAYFERHGTPRTPADLSEHACLGYTYSSEHDQWRFEHHGNVFRVRVDGPLTANNGDVLRLAAVAGGGIILQPTFIVGDDVRAGRLQIVLEDYTLEVLNVYAVYPHRQYLSAKVRTFVDFLAGYFGRPPYWDRPT